MDHESCVEAVATLVATRLLQEPREGRPRNRLLEYELWLRTRDSNPEPCG
jgi:hypothetical protein